MADVAVVTANLGGYDVPHGAVEQSIDADWYYVTHTLSIVDRELPIPPPWRWSPLPPVQGVAPRMAAKPYRMTPWEFLPDHYEHIIWIDASMEITSPAFVAEAIASLPEGVPLAAWRHPRRDCVYQEIIGSLDEAPAKYEPIAQQLMAQGTAYRLNEGYPKRNGLYATGTLVWSDTPDARKLGGAWLDECRRTTYQDQVSLPVVAWRLGLEIATFPWPQIDRSVPTTRRRHGPRALENRWMRLHPHTRDD